MRSCWYLTSVEFGELERSLLSVTLQDPVLYPGLLGVDSEVQTAHQKMSVKGNLDLDMFIYQVSLSKSETERQRGTERRTKERREIY